jgi:hypothetical protein
MVPSVAFPPATPLTLQFTAVSVVLVTVAASISWFPSITEAVVGVMVTPMEGGGGGGGALPEPQPSVHAPPARSAIATVALVVCVFPLLCERDRMPHPKAGEGPAKGKRSPRQGIGDSKSASG